VAKFVASLAHLLAVRDEPAATASLTWASLATPPVTPAATPTARATVLPSPSASASGPPTQITPAATITTGLPYSGSPGLGAIRVSITTPSEAYTGQWVTVYETDTDASGEPVPGDWVDDAYIDDTGTTTIDLAPGTYIVYTDLPGLTWGDLDDDLLSGVTVRAGQLTSIDIRLGSLNFSVLTVDGVVTGHWSTIYSQVNDASGRPVTDDWLMDMYIDDTGIGSRLLTPGVYAVTTDLDGYNWGDLANDEGTSGVVIQPGQTTSLVVRLGRVNVTASEGTWVELYYQDLDATGHPVRGDWVTQGYVDNTLHVAFDVTPGTYVVVSEDIEYLNVSVTGGGTARVP
jgi:hypothetical protein